MSQQRQADVLIMAQEDDWDAGRNYAAEPEPATEYEDNEAARPPLSDYLREEYTDD